MINYQELMKKYLGEGSRSTKFNVEMQFSNIANLGISSDSSDLSQTFSVLCKTTSLPDKAISNQEIKFRGQSIRIPIQSNFNGTWQCTFYNDTNHKLRKFFEDWSNVINGTRGFIDNLKSDPKNYIVDEVKIKQYDKDVQIFNSENANPSRTYVLYGVYPTNITSIDLGSEAESIEEFTVNFAFTYYEIE